MKCCQRHQQALLWIVPIKSAFSHRVDNYEWDRKIEHSAFLHCTVDSQHLYLHLSSSLWKSIPFHISEVLMRVLRTLDIWQLYFLPAYQNKCCPHLEQVIQVIHLTFVNFDISIDLYESKILGKKQDQKIVFKHFKANRIQGGSIYAENRKYSFCIFIHWYLIVLSAVADEVFLYNGINSRLRIFMSEIPKQMTYRHV